MAKNEVDSPCVEHGRAKVIGRIKLEDIIDSYDEIGVDVRPYIDCDVAIYKCISTGYRFFYPHDLAGKAEFYSELSSTRNYYSKWRWEHQVALDLFEETRPRKIFEFGCGPGNFLKRNLQSDLYGSDFNSNVIQKLRNEAKITVVEPSTFDYELESIGIDAVCMFQVLEHIPQVNEFMNRVNRILSTNGFLVVGVPNNNPYLYRWDIHHALNMPPHHMGLWDGGSLLKAMKYYGYRMVKIEYEPFSNPEHWLKLNLLHYFGKKVGLRLFTRFRTNFGKLDWAQTLIHGRNLIGVFQKQ